MFTARYGLNVYIYFKLIFLFKFPSHTEHSAGQCLVCNVMKQRLEPSVFTPLYDVIIQEQPAVIQTASLVAWIILFATVTCFCMHCKVMQVFIPCEYIRTSLHMYNNCHVPLVSTSNSGSWFLTLISFLQFFFYKKTSREL